VPGKELISSVVDSPVVCIGMFPPDAALATRIGLIAGSSDSGNDYVRTQGNWLPVVYTAFMSTDWEWQYCTRYLSTESS
jgi:hypothetical protein